MSQLHVFSNKSKNNKGYVALMSVMIISVVGAGVAISLLTLGNAYERFVFTFQEEYVAQALAQSCANKALRQIRSNALYTGNENVDFGFGHCDILSVTELGGTYTVNVQGVADSVLQKTRIIVARAEDPDTSAVSLTVKYWQDVADF